MSERGKSSFALKSIHKFFLFVYLRIVLVSVTKLLDQRISNFPIFVLFVVAFFLYREWGDY